MPFWSVNNEGEFVWTSVSAGGTNDLSWTAAQPRRRRLTKLQRRRARQMADLVLLEQMWKLPAKGSVSE